MQTKSPLDIADIFRRVTPDRLSPERLRVYLAITRCRTAELGGHINKCADCGQEEQSYNSCWNRHCPKCQGGAAFQWTAKRTGELLPVPYFHVVFTLPDGLRELCFYNKRIIYEIFFRSASQTLLEVSNNNHGVKLGFFGVLHSWNQELNYHPHLHFVVPGGGINAAGEWQELRSSKNERTKKFLLPVKILSKVFRGIFVAALKDAYSKDKLYLERELTCFKNPQEFEHLISKVAGKDWVVYAKRPFAGPDVVLKYLSNYTHRVAISNRRLRAISDTEVKFSARDRTRKGKKKIITLRHEVFVQRFLQHTLPTRFRRIRYFGFMVNAKKALMLKQIRNQLQTQQDLSQQQPVTNKLQPQCAGCGSKNLKRLRIFYNPHRPARTWQPGAAKSSPVACLSPPESA